MAALGAFTGSLKSLSSSDLGSRRAFDEQLSSLQSEKTALLENGFLFFFIVLFGLGGLDDSGDLAMMVVLISTLLATPNMSIPQDAQEDRG